MSIDMTKLVPLINFQQLLTSEGFAEHLPTAKVVYDLAIGDGLTHEQALGAIFSAGMGFYAEWMEMQDKKNAH